MLKKENLLLYAITDSSALGAFTLEEKTELALKGGATMIQLREKNADPETFFAGCNKNQRNLPQILCAPHYK